MTSNEDHTSTDAAEQTSDGLDPTLGEDEVLAMLKRGHLAAATLESIARSPASKSRKITLALIGQPRTPRHIALSLLRNLFTFDLMSVGVMPTVAADIKIASEESLINRLEKLSIGEKLSLARRASARVVSALINESDARVVNMALENPRITEAMVVKSLVRFNSSELLAETVRLHPKWSIGPEIQAALQRRADRISRNHPPGQTAAKSDG
jgi:hypothetical protein